MKEKKLNNFPIHPIGIGTWMMGGGYYPESKLPFASYEKDKEEIAAIKFSIKKGQNHIDTAWMYSAGHSEEVVGQAIAGEDRSKLFIADKLWKTHARRRSVIPAVKEMLRRLNTNYLDMLYIHAPWPEEEMSEYIGGINDAMKEGLTKSIAVSNFNIEQLKQAMDLSDNPIIANQLRYNVLYKEDANKEMLEFCAANGIMIVAYRPVERKLLADRLVNKTVAEIATKYGKTPAQIAINWLISQENVVAIPKASAIEHIEENLGAMDFELEADDFEKLNRIPDID